MTTEPKPSRPVLEYLRGATPFVGPLAAQIALVLEQTCTQAGVGWRHVVDKGSTPAVVRARRATARALRALDLGDGRKLSLPEIGLIMGGKDHTTILYYLRELKAVAADRPAGI